MYNTHCVHTPTVQVACYAILPGVLEQWAEAAGTDGHQQEVYWVYIPSVLGSLGFVFASYVYVVEVTHDHTTLRTHPNPNPNSSPTPHPHPGTLTPTPTPDPQPQPQPLTRSR